MGIDMQFNEGMMETKETLEEKVKQLELRILQLGLSKVQYIPYPVYPTWPSYPTNPTWYYQTTCGGSAIGGTTSGG